MGEIGCSLGVTVILYTDATDVTDSYGESL
jgi:hypothetical protein